LKWLGQHIWHFISRFRSDVYLEDLSTTTGTNVLVVDADGKVTKNTDPFIKNDGDTIKGTLTIDKDYTGTTTATTDGVLIDIDQTGNIASGQTARNTGLGVTINSETGTNAGTIADLGMGITVVGGTDGTSTATGMSIVTSGSDYNTGIEVTQTSGSHLTLKYDGDDYATFAVSSTADLTIATVGSGTRNSDLILDADGDIKLEPAAGNKILLDGTIEVDAGVITEATSITSDSFTGDIVGQASTVATIAGLAPNTATTQATQAAITTCANLVTVGTIGTGVWEGTAIATDQQKHLMHYEFMGFNNSTADTVYEYAESMNDTKAPLEHTADHNATITTAMVVGTFFKSGGQVMPQAGTIKRIVGWAHTNGTVAEHKLALVMLRPAEDDNTAVAPVLVDEITWTSLGGNKLKAINETTITAAGVNAGDILMTMIKDDTGGRQVFFNITIELEV
jgi:hypothetical protein